jgi:hypothetical protein
MTTATATTSEGSLSGLKNPWTFILIIFVVFLTANTVYQVRRKGKTVGQALKDDAKLLASPTAVVAILGFITGLTEYIIISNVNEYGFPDSLKGGKIFSLPPKKELFQTMATLLIVSVITGFLTDLALKALPGEAKAGLHHRLMGEK